jgi:hypothetical protein
LIQIAIPTPAADGRRRQEAVGASDAPTSGADFAILHLGRIAYGHIFYLRN